jgi:acrylyl-CoA reductase (NADPH)
VTEIPETFRAFLAGSPAVDRFRRGVRDAFPAADLPDGEVEVRIDWSSVNYKDALATIPDGKVARINPIIPGIDLAGEVVASTDSSIVAGQQILAHGYDLGVARHGGYSEYTRLPADYVVPLPDGLSAREAMAVGTAGFTAAMSVAGLEARGLRPGEGPVLVTGASGGVGSCAVAMLAARGHEVWAATGKPEEEARLRSLGAAGVVPRDEVTAESSRPLESGRWAGAVDTVGGPILANVYAQTAYSGAVACCGMAASHELNTTVWPLILRNVSLLGVSSLRPSKALRNEAWGRLAEDVDRAVLAKLSRSEPLTNIFALAAEITAGKVRGRIVIDVNT